MPFLVSTLNYNWKSILVAFSVASFSIFESKTNKNSLIYAIYVCFCLFFHKFDPYSSKSRTFMPFLGSTLNSKLKKHRCCFFCCFILGFWEQKRPLKMPSMVVFPCFSNFSTQYGQLYPILMSFLESSFNFRWKKHLSCFFSRFILDFCEPNYQKQPIKCHKWVEHATSRRKKMGFWLFLGGPNTIYDIRGSWRTHFKTRFTNIRNFFSLLFFHWFPRA